MSKEKKLRSSLTYQERQMIEIRLRCKLGLRAIARELGRDHTIIVREISRNRDRDGRYRAVSADQKARTKARITNKKKMDKNDFLFKYVVEKLTEGWSPEQVAGRLKSQPLPWLKDQTISHETIYRYIYEGLYGRFLYRYLRRKRRPLRQKRGGRQKQVKLAIPERVSIHKRPKEIEERRRYGDWESDSAQFRQQKAGLSVQYERTTQLNRLHRISDRSAKETKEALIASIESLPPELWQSITFDNGLEAAEHVRLKKDYGLLTYFCDPYKSWQKGGVENLIGLLRQYLPKRAKLDTFSDRQLQEIQEKLNNRPRKKLNWKTPNEMIAEYKKHQLGGA